jgi:hypothetical protein
MILGMIGKFILLVMLSGAMWAQANQVPKIRIVFPESHSEKAWMTYGLHHPANNNWHVNYGASMQAGRSSFEIQAETNRFKAVGWAPGCEMKQFDVAVEKSDLHLRFTCDPLNTILFHGRVEGVDVGNAARISVSYQSIGILFWFHEGNERWAGSSPAPGIREIATAAIAPDGTFKLDLPDFSSDPIASDDPSAELEFWISGLKDHYILRPRSTNGIETGVISIRVAPSYPAEVTFLAVSLRDFR